MTAIERNLLPHHQALIDASTISAEVANARGYWSATTKAELMQLGFKDYQARVPALVLPVHTVTGEVGTYQIRPDKPRANAKTGKVVKYETMAGRGLCIDVPPIVQPMLADPAIPLFVTEGIRKADAAASAGLACIDLLGVWGWRGKNKAGGSTVLACWESIALKRRAVFVVFDSDVTTKPEVRTALNRLYGYLVSKGARPHIITLPGGEGGKTGLDDYLAEGHGVDELLALVADGVDDVGTTTATVILDDVLRDVAAMLRVYVAFGSKAQLVAITLWVALTHIFEQFETTPYLSITSPEKRSGKTRVLDVLELLVARAWRAVLPSEPVTFRKIARDAPTLLLDEVDALYGPKAGPHEGLRAILNAGHRRGSSVPRCVGEGQQLVDFPVYCPKALAGIGDLPDTVADRSIPIRMQRRSASERVDRFRYGDASKVAKGIRERLERWALHADERRAEPQVPVQLNDRAADGWEPLLAIADLAGGEWPTLARSAAIELHADAVDDDQSLGVRLLADIRMVFHATAGAHAIFTDRLLDALHAMDESPWGDLRGKPLSARTLAFLLKPYGIRRTSVRVGDRAAKGYRRDDFREAWARYLATPESANPLETAIQRSQGHNATESSAYADSDGSHAVAENGKGHTENEEESARYEDCDPVTFENEEKGGREDSGAEGEQWEL